MLSLANAFNEEDLLNFEKRILNFISEKENFKITYSAEPKIDGISASLIYKDGKFIRDYQEEMVKKEKISQQILKQLKIFHKKFQQKFSE